MDTQSQPDPDTPGKSDQELHDILHTFEQILEIMPNDLSTLEAAEQAAQQCGEDKKALDYRLRMVEILTEAGDTEGIERIAEILRLDRDPRARAWIDSYDQQERTEEIEQPPAAPQTPREAAAVNITEEIDLAWKLFEQQQITQEDYATLVHDLTELSSSKSTETISVLHALEATHHKQLENILAYMAQTSRLPYISLSCFTMRAELAPLLPFDYIRHRGVLPFEMLGKEALIAVLNPYSEPLRKDTETRIGRKCHFYLARASEFDVAVNQLREAAN
jgi:hypothetical protein